jgi:uncharacterized membrane protein YbhN (UPF0104 family)
VTIGALAWIFSTTDLAHLVETFRTADWGLFFGSMCALYFGLWVVDSAAVHWAYRRYHAPTLRLVDVLPARGFTYLLGIVNYAAGTASMALWFRRRFGVGLVEGGATIVLLMLIDLGVLTAVSLVGFTSLPEVFRAPTALVAIAFAIGAAFHLAFWRGPWRWGRIEAIRSHPSLRGFREARLADYAVLGVLRLPVIALYVAMHFFTLRAFDIHIPVERLLVYVPIQMVIAALPISVAGLGTVQAAQRVLYGPFVALSLGALASDPQTLAAIDAYGLALVIGFAVPRVLIGLLCLRTVSSGLSEGMPSVAAEPAEPHGA